MLYIFNYREVYDYLVNWAGLIDTGSETYYYRIHGTAFENDINKQKELTVENWNDSPIFQINNIKNEEIIYRAM